MKNKIFTSVILILFYCVTVFAEVDKNIYLNDIKIESNAIENFINNFYDDFNNFKIKYKSFLKNYFNEIKNLDYTYSLVDDLSLATHIVNPQIFLEGDNLRFSIIIKNKDDKQIGSERSFLVNIYEDINVKETAIEYNTKSIFFQCFDIYWLIFVSGKQKGVSPIIVETMKNFYKNEIVKTKRGLIFENEKNRKIAEILEQSDCIEVECISNIAPFLYCIDMDFEKNDVGTINVNVTLSKDGNTFNPSSFVFTEKEFGESFNNNTALPQVTDSAFELMNVYNLDFFNEKLIEIKNIVREKGDFQQAKIKLDDLSKKFNKENFQIKIKEYSDYLNNSIDKQALVKKKNPLPVFPAVFGTLTLSFAIPGAVFTYLYVSDSALEKNYYDKYQTAVNEADISSYKQSYLNYFNSANKDLAVIVVMYTFSGVFLIPGIIGLAVQLATLSTTKKQLINDANKLDILKNISFDFNADFKNNLEFSFAYKF